MDRSQHTYSSLDELRQIQTEARKSKSLEALRHCYERVQSLRRAHTEDFDLQLEIAKVQEEIIERARTIRDQPEERASIYFEENPPTHLVRGRARPEASEAAEIAPETPRVDRDTWRRAIFLAVLLTAIICAAFFYLIQTARKINLPQSEAPNQSASATNQKSAPAQPVANPTPPPVSPTVRLYTDLSPGTVSIDEGEPQDLKDGELVLDKLSPGRHSIKVTGRGGVAAFSFDVAEKSAPRVIGLPTASNVMAVLVSAEEGRGRLITNAQNAQVSLDGKPAGQVGADGLSLEGLGTTDHDIQVIQDKDRQRFVLTYTAAPALTAYVKSDPNAGTAVIVTGQDGVEIYINDALYRRKTDHGQLRIPLKVGEYTIRAHKSGFIDPPPEVIQVKKGEESAAEFRMHPVPEIATLQIKGALPGTMVYVDKDVAAVIGSDGNANISNIKPGDHMIELRRDQALPKRLQRSFHTGDVVVLSGPDVTLEKVVAENTPPPPAEAPGNKKDTAPNYSMEMEGSQVRKGGGFVPYHVPKVAGHYTFALQGRVGGFLKNRKLQWYAGYQDSENYILFTIDGKRATIREVRDGKSTEVSKTSFNIDSNQWVQADMSVKPDSISARVKTPDGAWNDIGTVTNAGRDFTQDKVGLYIPGNDEVAVSNFKFSNR